MLITANDIRVEFAEIVMPRIGAWHADITLAETSAGELSGPVVVVVGGKVTFRGTAFRVGNFREREAVRIVGGAGGLATVITPTQRRGVTVKAILQGILSEAGETLSLLSTSSVLNTPVATWTPRAGSAASAIQQLLDTATPGAVWRVLDDGSVWVGNETWLPADDDVQILSEALTEGHQTIVADLPTLRPGVTLNERRVSAVAHRFEPTRVRTQVWYEGKASTTDRLKAAFFGLANHALNRVDHFATYAGRVIRQQGDGRLEVRADDKRFRGLAAVAMRPGVHGITTTVRRGARVLFGFENGDPRKPVATGWESGTPEALTIEADAINLGETATRGVVRLDDLANGGTFSVGAPPVTLVYTAPNGVSWGLTMVAGVNPVTATIVPLSNPADAGKLVSKNTEASTSVKAK